MKKSLYILLMFLALIFSGCSSKKISLLDKKVAQSSGFMNHYDKPYYEVLTSQGIEDLAIYLPKDTTTIRLKMKVSNLEDVIYMKLVSFGMFEIDKVLRRVENIKDLGYEQDGYMYEPSVEKDMVTLQIYVPSIYLYNGIYKPKLVFSFKRNSRSIQEKVQLAFVKQKYTVVYEDSREKPKYLTISEFCEASNKEDDEFFKQLSEVNQNRVYVDTIKDIENLCK